MLDTNNDDSMKFVEYGQGPTVVLLLPKSSSSVEAQQLVDHLAKSRRVIILDWRSCHQAQDSKNVYSLDILITGLCEFVCRLNLKTVDVLCHSTGCGLGIGLAARNPHLVSRLCLAAPWTHGDPYLRMIQNLRVKAATLMGEKAYDELNSLILFSPNSVMQQLIEAKNSSLDSPQQQLDVKEIVGRINAILDFDARPLLSKIKSKTLVMAARDDLLMPPQYSKRIVEGITDACYREFDAGGHMFPITQAECFADEVLKFLDA